MADIVISYSKKEPDVARNLADGLALKGYSVWWDTEILAGDDFGDVIKEQMTQAKVVIVIWTPHSVKSVWVRSEAKCATELKKLVTVRVPGVADLDIPQPFQHSPHRGRQ